MHETWTETDALAPRAATEMAIHEAFQARIARAQQAANQAVREGRTDWDAAQQWVAAVIDRAEADRDAALLELAGADAGEVPADAPCSNYACANAAPHTPCHCYHCFGVGHGYVTAQVQEAARVKAAARHAAAGGVFEFLRAAGGLFDDTDQF